MIAVLHIPGRYAERQVVLPAAPVPGDRIEADGVEWVVRSRRFVVPADGEAVIALHVVRAEDSQ